MGEHFMIIQGNSPEPAHINGSANHKQFYLNDFVYVPILKNAHRYTSTVLTAYNFKLKEINEIIDLKNKKIIVVLREPINRWYAGMSQFLNWQIPKLNINNDVMDVLTHSIVMDGHTRSQVNFLSGIDSDQCVFFNCEDIDFEKNLHNYCRRYLGGKVDMNNLINKPPTYRTITPNYIRLKIQLQEHCSSTHLARLCSYYQDDFNLIDNVQFYKG